MDGFFTQKKCDRCGGSLDGGRIMSMYSAECICLECHRKEKLNKDYDLAAKADHDEIKKGNFNYEGMYEYK